MNHRAVQRALFRMQLDPGFAARLRAGGAAPGLGAAELALLRGADAAGLSADRDRRRRGQFLRNVSGEFARSCAAGVSAEAFTSSPEFHAAVAGDASLPLAFGSYAARCSASGSRAQRALVALERALARARRELRAEVAPGPGELMLAPRAWLVTLPAGTLELAAGARAALAPAGEETVLVLGARERAPFRLREVEAELVSPDLARLLESLERPRSRCELRADGNGIVDELLADGVLVEAT